MECNDSGTLCAGGCVNAQFSLCSSSHSPKDELTSEGVGGARTEIEPSLPVLPTSLPASKSFTTSSTLEIRSPRCRLPVFAGDNDSGIYWLTHGVRRRWQLMQILPPDSENMHLIFRRLHSQQERVPFRILCNVDISHFMAFQQVREEVTRS